MVGPVLVRRSHHEGGDMKKTALTLVGALSLLLVAGSAFAQSNEVRANVPFDFVVNKTTMPAGTYQIVNGGTLGSETIAIRGMNIKASKLVTTSGEESSEPSAKTKLVFHRLGDRYFLSQIWVEGSDRVRQLPKSQLESEVAMDYATQEVVLVASR
jgi:hypothetical protein